MSDPATAASLHSGEATVAACTTCGAATEPDRGRLTLWYGDDLVVVEGVPARVCTTCSETFYGDDVVARVERLVAGGAERPSPVRTVEAEVYAWEDL